MPQLKYAYRATVTFSEKIHSHSFLLRLEPFENEAQHIIENNFHISPSGEITQGIDTFGNKIVTGYIDELHNFFEFSSEGILETYDYILKEELHPIYLFQSKYTKPDTAILELSKHLSNKEKKTVEEKMVIFSNLLNHHIQYEGGVTSIQTTAEESLRLGKGVCQDFSHLLISLCRIHGIPARYIAGFIEGEGFTHAWIEYYDSGYWHAFDPTHNRKVESGYIKIAQGRDYGDCALDKGVFKGIAFQQLDVIVKVEHDQQ
ncbi:MAG: transglutaminase family protein [Dysgonamonadaceae bacterium]